MPAYDSQASKIKRKVKTLEAEGKQCRLQPEDAEAVAIADNISEVLTNFNVDLVRKKCGAVTTELHQMRLGE